MLELLIRSAIVPLRMNPTSSMRQREVNPTLLTKDGKKGGLYAVAMLYFVGASLFLRAEVVPWPLMALDLANQEANSIGCLNNLKQIILAGRTWAAENGEGYPLGFQDFTNELALPSLLYCPANVAHQAQTNWSAVDWAGIDYEWVTHANWNDPGDVCCRCWAHNHQALANGSVQEIAGYRGGWPAITAPPVGQMATPNSDIRFEVRIAPDALLPVGYQWRREQLHYETNVTFDTGGERWVTNIVGTFALTNLDGQTNATLEIENAQASSSDYYSVVVSNRLGASASSQARLVVDPSMQATLTNEYWLELNCINHLKQLQLFGMLWSFAHAGHMPTSLLVMTNSYGSPMFGWPVVLSCPSDKTRAVPADWPQVNFADASYEVLAGDDQDPDAVFCRCKVHGFSALMGGTLDTRPSFSGLRSLTNNALELSFVLCPGRSNIVESSSDLANWAPLAAYSGTNGETRLLETNNLPRRFYRIRTP